MHTSTTFPTLKSLDPHAVVHTSTCFRAVVLIWVLAFFLGELTDPMVLRDPVEEGMRAKFAEAWFTRVNTENRREL